MPGEWFGVFLVWCSLQVCNLWSGKVRHLDRSGEIFLGLYSKISQLRFTPFEMTLLVKFIFRYPPAQIKMPILTKHL